METIENKLGKIFNIQRFSVYDGPGIRTVVFFSGCNLNCAWCHNPESVPNRQQLRFNSDQCILCGRCFDLCEKKAHGLKDGEHILDRSKCDVCLNCTKECYAESLVPVYREMTLFELEKSILTDKEYFSHSKGGVTFSGGEPMLQIDYLRDILKICKNRDIHTAVDTAGAVGFDAFEKILPYCDLILYDVKAYDNDIHKKLTGISNELIFENLIRLTNIDGANICVRVPVIVGANIDEMESIADFLNGIKINKYELLPYHKLGEGKYKSLGITSENKFDMPDENLMNEIINLFRTRNINIES